MIETERLILRGITMEDAQDIYAYSKEANVGPNAGWKPHESIEETKKIMDEIFINKEGVFGIVLKGTGRLIGTVGLIEDPKRENKRARMLGYAMSEKYWGHGYMTEAVKAVIRYGFEKQDLSIISAYCYPHNARSKSVIRKCGFEYEGTLKLCETSFNGITYDNECYSLQRL